MIERTKSQSCGTNDIPRFCSKKIWFVKLTCLDSLVIKRAFMHASNRQSSCSFPRNLAMADLKTLRNFAVAEITTVGEVSEA